MQDFKQLDVWQRSHELTLTVYRVTKSFPKEELFGLTSQMRRCSASIGANIAEGCGRKRGLDFARFLQLAMGSASELECHFLLARDLGYITTEFHANMEKEAMGVKRMITGLMKSVQSSSR